MKILADEPKVFVKASKTHIHLSRASHFCFEGDAIYLPWLISYAKKCPLALPPLSLTHLPPFTQKILLKLQDLPFGSTCAYSDLDPKAARAVGSACGRNPFPLLIPCHRVLGKHSLGGFSLDLEIKKILLNFESTYNLF